MAGHKADKTQLTPREEQILEMRNRGMTCPQIAEELGIAVATVWSHYYSIKWRLASANPSCSDSAAVLSGEDEDIASDCTLDRSEAVL